MGVNAFQKLFGDAIKALCGAMWPWTRARAACKGEGEFADGFGVDVFHVTSLPGVKVCHSCGSGH